MHNGFEQNSSTRLFLDLNARISIFVASIISVDNILMLNNCNAEYFIIQVLHFS